MQIRLTQIDLEDAVRSHMAAMGFTQHVEAVTFTATRGAEGIVAEVEIRALNAKDTVAPVAAAPVPAKPAATKAVDPSPTKGEQEKDADEGNVTTPADSEKKSLFG